MLNYLGQGGLLLADPHAAENPFYLLVPRWAHYPMVAFATIAGHGINGYLEALDLIATRLAGPRG